MNGFCLEAPNRKIKPKFRLLGQWLLGRNVSVQGSEEKAHFNKIWTFCPSGGKKVQSETGKGGAYETQGAGLKKQEEEGLKKKL